MLERAEPEVCGEIAAQKAWEPGSSRWVEGLEGRVREVYPLRPVRQRRKHALCWEPFPTLYWLADEVAHRNIAELESRGWIGRLQQRLQDSVEAQQDMRRAHQRYAEQRWAMLQPQHQQWAQLHGCADV